MRLSPSTAILRAQPDERLVELAGAGSESAFAAIVERYRAEILRACRRVLPEARAEDAVQQVFISAWKALLRGDQVRDLRPWLHAIARNAALDALRSPGYDLDQLQDTVPAGDVPEVQLERREAVRSALNGLAALPDRQRIVMLSSAVGGLSHADIAARMGMTEGATRQMLLRARTTLRSAVAGLTPPPLVAWAATGGAGEGGGTALQRIAELAAGGSAGAGAIAAKLGVVAVVATGAAATPGVVHDLQSDTATSVARAATASRPSAARQGRLTAALVHERAPSGRATSHPAGPGAPGHGRHGRPSPTSSEHGSSSHQRSRPSSSGRSGPSEPPSPSGENAPNVVSGSDDHGGSGGSSGSSGSHDGTTSHNDSSGSGSGSDDGTTIPAAPTPSPTVDDSSGHGGGGGSTSGSGSTNSGSGSTSSGSGSTSSGSGSTSSGSGSTSSGSGSTSSGSGSSGSGSGSSSGSGSGSSSGTGSSGPGGG